MLIRRSSSQVFAGRVEDRTISVLACFSFLWGSKTPVQTGRAVVQWQ